MSDTFFENPFRPGAGHMPPYLAGRFEEEREFRRLLTQTAILENLILTGLRGVGKTVLLEKLKPIAIQERWLWIGTDMSESTSVSEVSLATRLITDLAVVTSSFTVKAGQTEGVGFGSVSSDILQPVNYHYLSQLYDASAGLPSDKLKTLLGFVARIIAASPFRGIVFAYDEAQNLADNAPRDQFPLSLMLEVFQSIQRTGTPFMLVLAGLPTLFPKLVEARTYAERMFRVLSLSRLESKDAEDAIRKPIQTAKCPLSFSDASVETIVSVSGGYPYFIQFICREVFDLWIQKFASGEEMSVPHEEILRKLDTDFFAGRWAKATDRQRELLYVIATLEEGEGEFSVQEIVAQSKLFLQKAFSPSHVSQMLSAMAESGLVFKNRHGKHSFAVPLMGQFVKRQPIPGTSTMPEMADVLLA